MSALLLLACMALQTGAPATELGTDPWPGAEGPLSNDVFLPTSREGLLALALGDEALARARPDAEVFDHWHAALAASAPGDSVPPRPVGPLAEVPSPWPDPDGTAARRTEGIERSVLRRLHALGDERRRGWVARFAALANEELAAAGARPAELEAVERRHPATPAAVRAALRLADWSFEQGRAPLAGTWLRRAREHRELAATEPGAPGPLDPLLSVDAGLAARAAALAAYESTFAGSGQRPPEAWEQAGSLRPAGFVPLPQRISPRPAAAGEPAPGLGVQPGVCFLPDGTAAVQTAERIHLIDPVRGELRGELVPSTLIERAHWIAGDAASRATEPPGWPLLPLAHGNSVIAVHGRTVGRARNALVCFELAPGQLEGLPRTRLRWALRGDELLSEGRLRSSGLGLSGVEFQPGLVLRGTQLFAQVREVNESFGGEGGARLSTDEEVSSWLVAIDLATGAVRWKRFLAKGLPLMRGDTRYGWSLPAVSAAQPLTSARENLFVGTHLGAAALVALDGRLLWTFKNRRRQAERGGWSGWAPPVSPAPGSAVLWAPADSDHLYWLRAEDGAPEDGDPGDRERGPLLHPPRAIGEAEVLLGGNAAEAVVLTRAGRELNASTWLARTGGRQDAPYLGPGERFTGHGLVSDARVLFATQRGLILLDRTRELYLLDYAPLSVPPREPPGPARGRSGSAEAGGTVWAHGDRVLVVGPLGTWLFEIAP